MQQHIIILNQPVLIEEKLLQNRAIALHITQIYKSTSIYSQMWRMLSMKNLIYDRVAYMYIIRKQA